MHTVLRPGLRQCLQLDIGRVPLLTPKVSNNSLKFIISKAKPLPYFQKPGIIQFKDMHPVQLEPVLGIFRKGKMPRLDHMLPEHVGVGR